MKTYLVFFGKSQDFDFYVFDENGYVSDFDSLIGDFDFLESKVFTVDDVKNKPILAKYNFKTTRNTTFSLLKLYSFAQAYSSSRIEGSIYGVALLSERDIPISETNNNILNMLIDNFSELSLTSLKFNKSEFKEDANKIWHAFTNDKVNYFNKIEYNGNPHISKNSKSVGFHIHNLLIDSTKLNNQIQDASKLYFSEDLNHLKRAAKKWKETFFLYHEVNGEYVEYKEAKENILPNRISYTNEVRNNHVFSNLESKNNLDPLVAELRNSLERERKIKFYLSISTAFLFLTTYFLSLAVLFLFFSPTDNRNINTNNRKENRTEPVNPVVTPESKSNSQNSSINMTDKRDKNMQPPKEKSENVRPKGKITTGKQIQSR